MRLLLFWRNDFGSAGVSFENHLGRLIDSFGYCLVDGTGRLYRETLISHVIPSKRLVELKLFENDTGIVELDGVKR